MNRKSLRVISEQKRRSYWEIINLSLAGLVLSMASLLLFPVLSLAQSEMLRLFSPDIGRSKFSMNYQATPYATEDVVGQPADFRLTQHNADLSIPLWKDSKNAWAMFGTFRGQEITTGAVLPDDNQSFPSGLWDLRFGPRFRHRWDNGWIGGGFFTLGSASDQLFASKNEMELQATVFTRIPHGERNAWIGLLSYSNNREFLNNIPLPGVGYWYEPSDRYRMLIGIPFAFFEVKPLKTMSLEFSYFPITSIRVKATYRIWPSLRVYGGFDWRNESYFRADRPVKSERLFYYEKRLSVGFQWDVFRYVFLDLAGGFAFDRIYFEAEKYQDSRVNEMEIENGPFISTRVGLRF